MSSGVKRSVTFFDLSVSDGLGCISDFGVSSLHKGTANAGRVCLDRKDTGGLGPKTLSLVTIKKCLTVKNFGRFFTLWILPSYVTVKRSYMPMFDIPFSVLNGLYP